MTITQANDILDNQTDEMQRLMEEQSEVARQTEHVRENVAKTAKEVTILTRYFDFCHLRDIDLTTGTTA